MEILHRLPLKSAVDQDRSVHGFDDVSEKLRTEKKRKDASESQLESRERASRITEERVGFDETHLGRIDLSPVLSRLPPFRFRELLLLHLRSSDPRDVFGDGSLHERVVEDGEVLKTEMNAEGGGDVVVDHSGLEKSQRWKR